MKIQLRNINDCNHFSIYQNFNNKYIETKYKNIESKLYYILIDNTICGIIGTNNYVKHDKYMLFYYLSNEYNLKIHQKIFHQFIKQLSNITISTLHIVINNSFIKLFKSIGFIFEHSINSEYSILKYHINLHHVLKYNYPYNKYFTSIEQINEKLVKLSNYKAKFIHGNSSKFVDKTSIKIDYNVEKHINDITDYFTDKCRVKALFKTSKYTPFEYYQENKGEIIFSSLKNNKFNFNLFEEKMFFNNKAKFCNNFQPTIAITLYKLFNAKSVFDSSAGWGDRLIAAIAANIKYTGVDPSTCLKPYYQNIINTLAKDPTKYKIINTGIEDVKVEDEDLYDITCSSPPFYDLEIYNDDNTQSITNYTSQEDWERKFLITLVEQNISVLKPNGYLILYIPLYPIFMKYMTEHDKLDYKGIFTFITTRKRNIMVWQKISK